MNNALPGLLLSCLLLSCATAPVPVGLPPVRETPSPGSRPTRAPAPPPRSIWISGDSMTRPFEEVHPNPVIKARHRPRIRGLWIWEVIDKSLEAEDAVTIQWIVNARTKQKFGLLFPQDVRRALQSVSWEPASPDDAVQAAVLQYAYEGETVVFLKKPLPRVKAPTAALQKVQLPAVKSIAGGYRVTFYTFTSDSEALKSGIDNRSLMRHTFEVGKDLFRPVSHKTLWDSLSAKKPKK